MQGDLSEGDTLVDVAKSFMSSRPPRASPSLFNHGCGSPPCSGLHYSSDKAPLASLNQNITYSKVFCKLIFIFSINMVSFFFFNIDQNYSTFHVAA